VLAGGGDYSGVLYTELLNADYLFSEEEIWDIVDSIGSTHELIFHAIICSKMLSADSVFRLLRLKAFDFDMCWLTFHYYGSDLATRVITAMQERGMPTFLLKTSGNITQFDLDVYQTKLAYARERQFDSEVSTNYSLA
jgi:hypothetical protein